MNVYGSLDKEKNHLQNTVFARCECCQNGFVELQTSVTNWNEIEGMHIAY